MRILRIAAKHNLKVVEDCAHAHAGTWKDKGAGSMGDLGAFSFQSTKLITSGEGGAVITNNLEYMERVQRLHQRWARKSHGQIPPSNYRF